MANLSIWLEATRPKTLSAAVCPVLIGTSLAYHDGFFDWRPASLCLLFALLIQVGTNFANDYLDGIKGMDTKDRIGPRRAVASGLIAPQAMKQAALLILAIAFCLGLLLIPFGGWWLLLVGIASVVCAWLYTGGPYPLAYNGLGDVFVVLFFGLVAVGCTYFVQARALTVDGLLLGLACGLVINNILVVNNYRDYEEDRKSSKRTLVVLLGRRVARLQFIVSYLIAALITVILSLSLNAIWLALALVALVPGFVAGLNLDKIEGEAAFARKLKSSAVVVVWFGILVSLGLII